MGMPERNCLFALFAHEEQIYMHIYDLFSLRKVDVYIHAVAKRNETSG